jgi:hypothetical protein
MMRLIVRMQRPHCVLQPRQRWTWTADRGAACAMAVRTWVSEMTLQEQTIMTADAGTSIEMLFDMVARSVLQKEIAL